MISRVIATDGSRYSVKIYIDKIIDLGPFVADQSDMAFDARMGEFATHNLIEMYYAGTSSISKYYKLTDYGKQFLLNANIELEKH